MDKTDIIYFAIVALVNVIVLYLAFRKDDTKGKKGHDEGTDKGPGPHGPGKEAEPESHGPGKEAGPVSPGPGKEAGPVSPGPGKDDRPGKDGGSGPHGSGEIKVNVRKKNEDKKIILECAKSAGRQCSICGSINYQKGDFCEVCGQELR